MNIQLFDSDGTEIPVEVRRSARAKNMRVEVKEDLHVYVTLPENVPESEVQPMIDRHKAWILRTLLKLRRGQVCTKMKFFRHPVRLTLPLAGVSYPVRYEWRNSPWIGAKLDDDVLTVTGRIPDAETVREVLQEWLVRRARYELGWKLQQMADRFGFHFVKMTVRLQEGRWGSCSTRGNISLNARLLLIPADLAEYVLIHELCHLKHMDHSAAFWKAVEQCCPDYEHRLERLKALERNKEIPLI